MFETARVGTVRLIGGVVTTVVMTGVVERTVTGAFPVTIKVDAIVGVGALVLVARAAGVPGAVLDGLTVG